MRFIIYLSVLFFSSIRSEIFEVKSIEEVELLEVGPRTLVLFDIDNTLIKLSQELGSDSWFYHRLTQLQKDGLNSELALQKAICEFNAIQNLSCYELVERSFLHLFERLKTTHTPCAGLTIRGFDLSLRTLEQLKEVGLLFNQELIDPLPKFLDPKTYLFTMGGVIFTFGKNKGEAICKFLDTIERKFDHVVVVDDKLHHLKAIEHCLEKRGVKVTGYRYGFLDDHVAKFCPIKASEQFNLLLPLIQGNL